MLTEIQIQENKANFINLIKSISREDALLEDLISHLEKFGFFEAPASIKYHCNYKGGLCEHSLHVYETLKNLVLLFPNVKISEDSIKIVALLHDLDKEDNYELTSNNRKVYCEDGNQWDSLGKFKWESYLGYKFADAKDRYIYGTHGQNSERVISYYIPLSEEESVSIINHMGTFEECDKNTLSEIYSRYPLAVLLHTADTLSTYLLEYNE